MLALRSREKNEVNVHLSYKRILLQIFQNYAIPSSITNAIYSQSQTQSYKYKQISERRKQPKMEQSQKEQILKMLNLDSMISDYLKQPKLNRKTPASNYNYGAKGRYKIDNGRMMNTVETLQGNKRNLSTGNFQKCATIEPNANCSHYQSTSAKVASSGNIKNYYSEGIDGKLKGKVPQGKKCASSKLFKTEKTFQTLGKDQFQQVEAIKKRKVENQSTNLNDSEDEINEIDLQPVEKRPKTMKRLASSQSESKCPKIGSVLKGRYQLQKVIGRGLSGQVYKAKDILSNRYVAIKIIQPSNIEYEFIKNLQHPNMISYYNSFIENGKRCIVLEYLAHSLAEIVRKRKLSEEEVKRIFHGIASGLMYLHSLAYAHRDIKPDNIVVNQDFSVVKFIDFGLCVDTNESDAKEMKRFCGTTSYMAPQVIAGRCREPKKADVWSLGVVLYVLNVGRNPFTGRQQDQIFNKIKNNKTIFPTEMPEKLKSLLSSMLSKNPEERPSVIEVVNHRWLIQ